MSNTDNKLNFNGSSQGIKIKTESGLSPPRLSSFKPPRDLTLGGNKAKKVFAPNLNAVRNKNKSITSNDSASERRRDGRPAIARGGGGRGSAGGARDGRGAGILKSGGVFSEGVAAGSRHSYSRGYSSESRDSGGDRAATLVKPTIKVKNVCKVDKNAEEQQIKELMNDDEENDLLSDTMAPTRLPISSNCSLISKMPESVAIHQQPIKEEVVVKNEPMDVVMIKEEPPEIKTENKVKMEFGCFKDPSFLLQTTQPTLLLLQFPDSLPGRGPEEEVEDKNKSTENKDSTKSSQNAPCTLKHLEEGQIGKIVIYKSGKIKLLVGNTYYDLSLGTQTCFRQDVMSIAVNTEERSGTMINLGCIQSKLTATPDWESMFQQMEAK